jgi:hypothetical protein
MQQVIRQSEGEREKERKRANVKLSVEKTTSNQRLVASFPYLDSG